MARTTTACKCGWPLDAAERCEACGVEGADYRPGERTAAAAEVPDKPEIKTGTGPETIRALQDAIDAGKIPAAYVSGGRVVHVEKVSGTVGGTSGDEDSPLPVTASEVTPPVLANLLATHTYTYKTKASNAAAARRR